MSVAVAVGSITTDPAQGLDSTRTSIVVRGTLTLTGSYGSASSHGDTVNLAGFVASSNVPKYCRIWEDQGAGNAPLGYTYIYNRGTTQANGQLVILGAGAGGALSGDPEFTQGNAYSTGSPSLNNAVLQFEAWFTKE